MAERWCGGRGMGESAMTHLRQIALVARRELKENLSDWRITVPAAVLTFIFPWLVISATDFGIQYAQRYDPELVVARLIPYATMVVGFFPISFSLVVALESFVGEKERNTLEALLSTPITDHALYLGKLLSSLALPVAGSFFAIALYTFGLRRATGQTVPADLLAQIALLILTLALGMVAGAVVVSSNTTSVRAANLLASFIVIPAMLLISFQALVVLWEQRHVLWYIAAAQALVDVGLIRMGVQLFNREELLSRTQDRIRPAQAVRTFCAFFRAEPFAAACRDSSAPLSLGRLYRRDLPQLLRRNAWTLALATLLLVGAFCLGWGFARTFPVSSGPAEAWPKTPEEWQALGADSLREFLGGTAWRIFLHNLSRLTGAGLAGMLSFGVAAAAPLLGTIGLLGFLAGEAAAAGMNVWALSALVWPHGILEVPALVLATAAGLRMGASVLAPPRGFSLGETLLLGLADFAKVLLLLVIPLLALAAVVEVYLTPHLALFFLGG